MYEPEHWRGRAEELIAMAEEAKDPQTKATMLSIAAGYERLAQQAEERLATARRREAASSPGAARTLPPRP